MSDEETADRVNVNGLREHVQLLLESLRSTYMWLSEVRWNPADGFLKIVRRAAVCRQFESLDAVVDLVDGQRGFAGVPLLRPACEEFIWLKYLNQIDRGDAEQLLVQIGRRELDESLSAQDEYSGRTAMREMGLDDALLRSRAERPDRKGKLQALGRKLKWEERTIEKAALPSMGFLARKTGERARYNFLYHASSRFVHFSTAELLRRAWGKDGAFTVRSANFHDYWSAFALFWGVALLVDTVGLVTASENFPDDVLDGDALLSAAKSIGEFGMVPIVTREELAGWG